MRDHRAEKVSGDEACLVLAQAMFRATQYFIGNISENKNMYVRNYLKNTNLLSLHGLIL